MTGSDSAPAAAPAGRVDPAAGESDAGPRPATSLVDEWDRPVRALVLDIDDTLVDTQAAMRSACRSGAAAAWPRRAAAEHERVSDVFYDDPGGFFDAYTRGELDFAGMRRVRYARALAALGLADEGFEGFEAAYLDAFAQDQHLFDDVAALFDAADARGVGLCFVTNSGDAQTALKLDVVGLSGRAPVVTTDTLGVGKPDPRLFEMAARLTGVEAADTVVVGDTHHTDVAGGRGAGMRVAWLQRADRPEPRNAGWELPVTDPGVRVVSDLKAVAAWL